MWYGRRIYFLSDRGAGFRANIWAYYLDARTFTQITHFSDFDVDTLSLGAATITFQQGGGLYAVDLPSATLREIKVRVPDDRLRTAARASGRQRGTAADAMGGVDYALSPDGRTLLLSVRGDLFGVATNGAAHDLTGTPGVDEDHPSWCPDGRMNTFRGSDATFDHRPHVTTGLLGTDYVLDAPSGRYRLSHILSGDNARADFRSPLIAPGLGLHDGDFILAVNGHELRAPTAPDEQLVGLTHELTITVAASADGPRRDVRVEPLENEGPLRRFE